MYTVTHIYAFQCLTIALKRNRLRKFYIKIKKYIYISFYVLNCIIDDKRNMCLSDNKMLVIFRIFTVMK